MLKGLFKGLKDLIYPNCCLVCKNRIQPAGQQQLICAGCWDKIEQNLPPFCASCGRHLTPEAIEKNACPSCWKFNFYFDRAFSPCAYSGAIKKLIHEFKYSGKDYLGKPLGKLMQTFIRDYQLPIAHLDFVIPIPLHKSRQREREFNQAEILSQEVAREFDKKALTDALIRVKPTKTQTELTFQERCQNVKESFAVAKPELIKDTNLLLIDDVLTTGATSSEAAKCLKESGARKVLLLTLAS
ncbi:MAG: ComF family protein [Candidatus Omnitrophica bacterium]|nr:ComF family protein [Candidatus Omnitrophota bacterium]